MIRLKAWRASVTVAACTWSNFIKHERVGGDIPRVLEEMGGMRGKEGRGSGTL